MIAERTRYTNTFTCFPRRLQGAALVTFSRDRSGWHQYAGMVADGTDGVEETIPCYQGGSRPRLTDPGQWGGMGPLHDRGHRRDSSFLSF